MGKKVRSFILLFFLWLGVFSWGLGSTPAFAELTDSFQERQFFNHVWQTIQHAYVDSTFNHQDWVKVRKEFSHRQFKSREETYDAVQEMLATLNDPFTRLLRPDQYRSMKTSTNGSLSGVGLQIAIDPDTNTLVVIAPIEGSPADQKGLLPLDRIIEIDGTSTKQLSLDECADRMRGPVGTEVTLRIDRGGTLEKPQETFSVTIVRDTISVNPIISKLNTEGDHKVGYIRLTQFNANAVRDMEKAITKLESQEADSYVLDLRGNPGGLLDAAIGITKLWISDGVVVYTVDRQGLEERFTVGENNHALTNDPLVILVDKGSASASEIVAAALHDNHRAKLLGRQTYGKGSVQSIFELEDGSGLAVTIARYETPSHTNINKIGIPPDVEITLTHPLKREQLGTSADEQYQAAVNLITNSVS